MRKRMPRLEWLRYSAFVLLYPLGCAGEIGVIEATIKHMTEPRESLFLRFKAKPLMLILSCNNNRTRTMGRVW